MVVWWLFVSAADAILPQADMCVTIIDVQGNWV
jgi:hypothetical protein